MRNYTLPLLSISIIFASCKAVNSDANYYDVDIRDENRVQTLPLLTYNGLKRRRMLEMGLDEQEMESHFDSVPIRANRGSSRRTSSEVGGLYQGYGTHYVDLWVGTPAQRQTVIVDTGSGVTAFPCMGCKDCGKAYHASPYFNEALSSTFVKMTCGSCEARSICAHKGKPDEYCKLSVAYQEGSSWTAYQARDETYLGGPHTFALDTDMAETTVGIADEDPADATSFRFPFRFGCQTKVTGLFKTQLADGIMGMCLQNEAFWHQMYDAQMISSKAFSLCFSKELEADAGGTLAGAITMGGSDTNLHLSPMVFAEGHVEALIMHGLTIRKLYFMKAGQYDAVDATIDNTVALDVTPEILNKGHVILDSGTTDTYFVRDISSAYRSVFKSMVGVDYNTNGMTLSAKQVELIPSLIVQLNGYSGTDQTFNFDDPDEIPGLAGKLDNIHPNDVLVVIPPSHYFEYDSTTKKYYPRIFPTEMSGTVLGANFMAGNDIMFDIAENKRVGFASSNCDYSALIGGTLLGGSINAFGTKTTSSGASSEEKMVVEGGDICYNSICGYHVAIFFACLVVILVVRDRYMQYRERCRLEQAEILSLSDLCVEREVGDQREESKQTQMARMKDIREIT